MLVTQDLELNQFEKSKNTYLATEPDPVRRPSDWRIPEVMDLIPWLPYVQKDLSLSESPGIGKKGEILLHTLVITTISSLLNPNFFIALPSITSLSPFEYVSAVMRVLVGRLVARAWFYSNSWLDGLISRQFKLDSKAH